MGFPGSPKHVPIHKNLLVMDQPVLTQRDKARQRVLLCLKTFKARGSAGANLYDAMLCF